MNEIERFEHERQNNIHRMAAEASLGQLGVEFMRRTIEYKYSYNFSWLGRPIIQFPQDIIAMQEIIWQVQPDLIIETGIAHGGSLIFLASLLELIGRNGHVLGVDIDIRAHNRVKIDGHPMAKRITMIQGSSVDENVIRQVHEFAKGYSRVLVALDSMHTHEHVLAELKAYAPLVKSGSYLVVFDTSIEDLPEGSFPDRPWSKSNNPKTAVWEFLNNNRRFVVDEEMDAKLLITSVRSGYLKCVGD
jgi:cephalosporin hydroxylase